MHHFILWKSNILLIFFKIASSLVPVTEASRPDPGSEGGVTTGQPMSSIQPALSRGQRRTAQASELQVSQWTQNFVEKIEMSLQWLLYSTLLYSTLLYATLLYSTLLYSTLLSPIQTFSQYK